MGIELKKYLSDTYRPRFILINLLDEAGTRPAMVIDQTLRINGLEVSIQYNKHEELYKDACDLMRQQSMVNLLSKPKLTDVIEAFFKFINEVYLGNPLSSCKAIMQLSHLLDDTSLKEQYFQEAISLLKSRVPEAMLESQTNGLNNWIKNIESLSKAQLEENITTHLNKFSFQDMPSVAIEYN